MASPLRWFRKHQQIMMVFFGVGLMAIFGLGSVFTMINPAEIGRSSDNPVIAKWNGGQFTRNDLRAMQTQHYAMQRFLGGLQQFAADQQGEGFRPLAPPITPLDEGREFDQDTVDTNSMQRYLLAEYADEEGFVVNDAMVEDYLSLNAGNSTVTRDEMMAINKKVNNTSNLDLIYARLKLELAAQQMDRFISAIPLIRSNTFEPSAVNPTEAIELYERMARRVECQVLPIAVDGSTVTDEPSNAELQALYEKGKTRIKGIDGALEPGFRVGRKVKVQYLAADFEAFLKAEMATLSDKEVQEEYDRMVEAADPMVMELVPLDSPLLPGGGDMPMNEPGTAEAPGGDETPAPPVTDPTGQDESSDGSTESDGSTGDDGSGDPPGISRSTRPADQFVSLKQDESAGNQESTQDEKQATDPPETTGAEQAAETKAEQSGEAADAADQDSPIQLPEIADPQQPEKRARPLKDVAEDIRRSLKSAAAMEKMNEATQKAARELGDYKYLYQRWKFAPEGGAPVEEPEPLDGEKIARDCNLQFFETPLVDYVELGTERIGQQTVMRAIPFQGQRFNIPIPVNNDIFQNFDTQQLFETSQANAADGSVFQYWLSEKQESYVPEFSEVKEQVLQFWKTQQAYDKAMVDAKEIAERLNGGENQLATEYPDTSVPTGQFSWFNSLGGLSVSNPNGIQNANDDLMKMIFQLEPAGVGFAANETKDNVYVVQLLSSGEPISEIASDYISNQFFRFQRLPEDISSASDFYAGQYARTWMEDFYDQFGFERVDP